MVMVGFISIGLFFWGLASYLFIFNKEEIPVGLAMPYWIESLVLFVAGIGIISFPLIYKSVRINMKKVSVVVLGTSLVAVGVCLAFALTIQAIGTGAIAAPIGFQLTMSLVIGALLVGFGSKIVSLNYNLQ